MLNIQLLNDEPQLNTYVNITSVQYIPGQTVQINFQLFGVDSGIRYMPPTEATVKATFKQSDGTSFDVIASKLFPNDDRSIWQVVVSSAQSQVLIGNSFLVTVDVNGDGSDLEQAIGSNMLTKNLFEGDC